MTTDKSPSWEILLSQNIDKSRSEAPDFAGEAYIGTGAYDSAAWFGTVNKGANKGRPYVSLTLSSNGSVSLQKVSINLWEKTNRAAETEPHFRTREKFNGQDLKFSAWVEPAGELHALRIVIEPFTVNPDDLSEAAKETQRRLNTFLAEAQLRLPGGRQQPELPTGKPSAGQANKILT
jgi:hypothetical protein